MCSPHVQIWKAASPYSSHPFAPPPPSASSASPSNHHHWVKCTIAKKRASIRDGLADSAMNKLWEASLRGAIDFASLTTTTTNRNVM